MKIPVVIQEWIENFIEKHDSCNCESCKKLMQEKDDGEICWEVLLDTIIIVCIDKVSNLLSFFHKKVKDNSLDMKALYRNSPLLSKDWEV